MPGRGGHPPPGGQQDDPRLDAANEAWVGYDMHGCRRSVLRRLPAGVTDWEPHEISLVAIAADPDARIRCEERSPAPRSNTSADIARARMRMRAAMAAAR